MPAVDALKAFWILALFFFLFFWLPAHLSSGRPNYRRVMRIAGNWARTVLCVTIFVFLLSCLKLLSAITVVLLIAGALGFPWFRNRAGIPAGLRTSLQAMAIKVIRTLEVRSFGLYFLPRQRASAPARPLAGRRIVPWLRVLEGREMLVACFAVALGTSVVLRAEHAVRELRFDQPQQYSALLRARELLLHLHPGDRPLVFPSVIASTSLLSSTDPTQVTRFLTPVVGLLVVLATGLLIHECTRSSVAGVTAVYYLGAVVLPPTRSQTGVALSAMGKLQSALSASSATSRAAPEFAFGLLFLLLALVFLADWYRGSRGWDALLDFVCCLLLAGIISKILLVVLLMSAGILLLRPMAGLFAFVTLCYGFAAYATLSTSITIPDEVSMLLPVASAIAVGCFLALIEAALVARNVGRAETVLFAACLGVAVLWLRPERSHGQYLEYEATARATQEIADKFPRQTWVVAAPVEQLAETLGLGGHEDLAEFVEKYRGHVSSPDFTFPDARDDLFVYVEKKPFQIFFREPETVSFSVLTDPVYRNYRSPGGRASLESAALQLCEIYRQHHPDADIFFENEDLRIYHIHHQQALATRAASKMGR